MLATPTLARPLPGHIKASALRACEYYSLVSIVLAIRLTFVFHVLVSVSLSLVLRTTSISTGAHCLNVQNMPPLLGRYLSTAPVCSFNLTRLSVLC